MTLVGSLNASGDVRFPLACSLTVLWLISLPFSYLLAIVFHMGLVGVWIAYAIDESLRAMLMISSSGMDLVCLMFFSFLRSRGGSADDQSRCMGAIGG